MFGNHPESQQTIKSGSDVLCGVLTLAIVALAFAALDDITADNATSFPVEYFCLLVSACWCLLLVARLARTKRVVLGGLSFLLLGVAIWGQRLIGPGTVPSWQPEYVATVSALCWFLGLSLFLVVSGFMVDWTEALVPDTAPSSTSSGGGASGHKPRTARASAGGRRPSRRGRET